MTEQEYKTPLETFELEVLTEAWSEVDVLGRGKEALKEVNDAMG